MTKVIHIDDSHEAELLLNNKRANEIEETTEDQERWSEEENARRYLTDEFPTVPTRFGRDSLTY